MVAESLVERKFDASRRFAQALIEQGAPLLAAYWEFREERERWVLVLVPTSAGKAGELIKEVSGLRTEQPNRSEFSVSDLVVSGHQIDRARALGAYIRIEPYIGRRIDTTFTGGHYFESVVPVYLRPDLLTHLHVA